MHTLLRVENAPGRSARTTTLRHICVQASGLDEEDLASAAQGTAGFSARDMGATASDAVLTIVRKCLEDDPSDSIDVVRPLQDHASAGP